MSRSFLLQKSINLVSTSDLSGVHWAPDGGGDGKTWQQIYTIINTSHAPLSIYLSGTTSTQFIIPAGTYDIGNSNFVGVRFGGFEFTITINNGALLQNVGRIIGGVKIESFGSSGNTIEGNFQNLDVFIAELGCVIKNSGTAPIFTVPNITPHFIGFFGAVTEVGNPAVAIMHIPVGSIGVLYCAEMAGPFTDNIISGPVGSTAVLEHDGTITFPFPAQTLFLGTFLNNPSGMNGGSGPTSFRPVTAIRPISIGCEYFDTDIGIPVYWTGAIWVDSAGVPA